MDLATNAQPKLFHLVFIAVCLSISSCSKQMNQTTQMEHAPTKLVLDQVLLDSNKKLFTAFADINRDGRPDMILGYNGHKFSDVAPRVQHAERYGAERHYVSHLLNKSIGDEIEFDAPYWPNPHGDDGQLTGG